MKILDPSLPAEGHECLRLAWKLTMWILCSFYPVEWHECQSSHDLKILNISTLYKFIHLQDIWYLKTIYIVWDEIFTKFKIEKLYDKLVIGWVDAGVKTSNACAWQNDACVHVVLPGTQWYLECVYVYIYTCDMYVMCQHTLYILYMYMYLY